MENLIQVQQLPRWPRSLMAGRDHATKWAWGKAKTYRAGSCLGIRMVRLLTSCKAQTSHVKIPETSIKVVVCDRDTAEPFWIR